MLKIIEQPHELDGTIKSIDSTKTVIAFIKTLRNVKSIKALADNLLKVDTEYALYYIHEEMDIEEYIGNCDNNDCQYFIQASVDCESCIECYKEFKEMVNDG